MAGSPAHRAPMTFTAETARPVPTLAAEGFAHPDPRAAFASAAAVAAATISAVEISHLELPTPCPELDVRHLLGHLVDVLRRVAIIGRGESIFSAAPLDV